MKPLYEAGSIFTYRGFCDLNFTMERQRRVYWSVLFAFEIVTLILAAYYFRTAGNRPMGLAFTAIAILFPPLLLLRLRSDIRRAFRAQAALKNVRILFRFYEEFFETRSTQSSVRIPYRSLRGIYMNRHRIFFIDAKGRGYILNRADCEDALIAFLSTKATQCLGRTAHVGNL